MSRRSLTAYRANVTPLAKWDWTTQKMGESRLTSRTLQTLTRHNSRHGARQLATSGALDARGLLCGARWHRVRTFPSSRPCRLSSHSVWDEWGFSRALGDRAAPVLREHFESWLNETDVEAMAEGGIKYVLLLPLTCCLFQRLRQPYPRTGWPLGAHTDRRQRAVRQRVSDDVCRAFDGVRSHARLIRQPC